MAPEEQCVERARRRFDQGELFLEALEDELQASGEEKAVIDFAIRSLEGKVPLHENHHLTDWTTYFRHFMRSRCDDPKRFGQLIRTGMNPSEAAEWVNTHSLVLSYIAAWYLMRDEQGEHFPPYIMRWCAKHRKTTPHDTIELFDEFVRWEGGNALP